METEWKQHDKQSLVVNKTAASNRTRSNFKQISPLGPEQLSERLHFENDYLKSAATAVSGQAEKLNEV